MLILFKRNRLIWNGIRLGVVIVILLFGLAYINDKPGGFADWRLSKAIGSEGTIQIPLGKTAEDALKQFRHYTDRVLVHKETVKGGALLFYKQFGDKSSDLQLDFVRKTWFGWKWVWGGGYGFGGDPSTLAAKSSLTYMNMSIMKNIFLPFSIVFGDILDPSIKKVNIVVKGAMPATYLAKLVETGPGKTIWFVLLPASVTTPYDIAAFNQKGEQVNYKTITDPNNSGLIDRLTK
jgi:hypothetical protein